MLDNFYITARRGGSVNQLFLLLILAIGASFSTLPLLLHNSLPLSQDIVFHIFQADQFNQNLNSGVLYPRWTAGAVSGYGSPNFIFYSPLPYYFVALLHLIIPSLISSMVVAVWFSFFVSGITMLVLVNHFFTGYRSVLPAVLYQILPFHLLELYVRGAFAGLFAYIWFPLIFLLLYKIHESKKSVIFMCCFSIAYAALIMTHLASAFMFSLIIGAVLLHFIFVRQNDTVLKIAAALSSGLCLASIYFIPVLLERKYVHIDYLVNGPFGKYVDNYLFTSNILHWKLSNFYVWLHLQVIADLTLFAAILFLAKKDGYNTRNPSFRVFIFIFLLSFILTIPLSKPLTDLLPWIHTLQFPWRWIAIMEVSLAFLSSYIFFRDEGICKSLRVMNQGVIFFVFIILSAVFILKTKMLTDNFVARIEHTEQLAAIMDPIAEYIPIWTQNWRSINLEPVTFISGRGSYIVNQWKPQDRIIKCMASVPSKLRIATFYYPGWEVSLDSKKSAFDIENNSGAIQIDIPRGDHIVKLQFVNTPLRNFAQFVSIITISSVIVVIILAHKKII